MRILLSAMLAVHALAQQPTLRVVYTGRLLGYPRIPGIQHLEETDCNASTTKRHKRYDHAPQPGRSPFADLLARQFDQARLDGRTLLLGMGDNFAMDFFSRVSVLKDCDGQQSYLAKDESAFKGGHWFDLSEMESVTDPVWKPLYEDQLSGNTEIDADNVATFFRESGYKALVPGKHDFYFGPERLRQLARLLHSGGDAKSVVMLGANLIIRSSHVDRPLVTPEFLREKRRNYSAHADGMAWALPRTPLPWMRALTLRGAFDSTGAALVRDAELCHQTQPDVKPAPDPRLAPRCFPLTVTASGTNARLALPPDLRLESERSYLTCVTVIAAPALPYCQPFNVAAPYFQYPDTAAAGFLGGREAATGTAMPTRVPPYAYVEQQGVVVMGAVAPGMERQVGALHSHWINRDPALDTAVITSDPAEALGQLWEYCVERGHCGPGRTHILLAQMPREAAEVLNRQLNNRFHIVLAQADSRFATPPQAVTYSAGYPPVVLVPRELYEPDQPRPGQTRKEPPYGAGVQWVDLTVAGGRITSASTGAVPREGIELPLTPGDCLSKPVARAWAAITGQPEPDIPGPTHFRTVVLEAMRRHRGADVAMVQERDFFALRELLRSCQSAPVEVQQQEATLEQILWKGDFVFTRTVRGSAIKAAMRRSKEFKAIEDDVYSIETERNRWLVTHGLTENPETRAWYVNGQAIEDGTLYSVAMTDYLGFGETGYAELETPAVPPAERPRDLLRMPRITEVVSILLNGHAPRKPLSLPTYLDHTSHLPFSPGPEATLGERFAGLIHGLHRRPDPDLALPRPAAKPAPVGSALAPRKNSAPTAESHGVVLGQTRSYWRLFLDKGDFGFADYSHNRETQTKLSSDFHGIPENGVLTRKQRTIASGVQVELRHEQPRRHFFTRLEEDYTLQRTQQDGEAGVFLNNYPSNLISLESGMRFAMSRVNRRRPWHGLLVSGIGTSQVRTPVESFQPGLECANPGRDHRCPERSTFREQAARTSRILGKTGYYFQGRESWLEAGVFLGGVVRPTSYTFGYEGASGRIEFVCSLRDDFVRIPSRSLSACFNPAGRRLAETARAWTLRAHSKLNPERGFFLNFNLRWNLPKRLTGMDQFAIENRGRYLFDTKHDLVLDTHINNTVKLGPVVRLLPSISLRPTLSLFYFQNRVTRASLLGRTVDLKIEYRFNHKTGDSWRQALEAGWPR